MKKSLYLYPPEGDDPGKKPDGDDPGKKPDGDGDDPSKGGDDPALLKEELQKTKADLAALRKKIKSSSSKEETHVPAEEVEKREKEIVSLKEKIKHFEEEQEKAKLEGKDETVKELYRANKTIADLEAQVKELKSQLEKKHGEVGELSAKYTEQLKKLREQSLEVEIREAAEAGNALRPNQIVDLTKKYYVYDDEFDRWVFPIFNKKGDMIDGKSIKEHIQEFLALPENDNLVRSGKKGGSGEPPASSASQQQGKDKDKDKDKGKKLQITEQLKKEAAMRDMDVEEWAELKQERERIRKEKMERMRSQ